MNLRFFLRLLGFDVAQPLAVIRKVLDLVGRTPFSSELSLLLMRATPSEQARIALDLQIAGAALSKGEPGRAAGCLTDILFSIK